MFVSQLADLAPFAFACAGCAVPLLVADMVTGTAFWQDRHNDERHTMTPQHSNHDDEHGSRFDYWDSFATWQPNEVDLADIDVTDDEIAGWDDIDGIDIDGTSGEYLDDSGNLITSVAWLHSLLYSDYQDAGDDDDRAALDIPASIIARADDEV